MIDREDVKKAADLAVEDAKSMGQELDYSERSLVGLEMALQILHALKNDSKPTTAQIANIAGPYGLYLGELMLRGGLEDLGFTWQENPAGEAALMRENSNDMILPIQRVFKHIINGKDQDVVRFYSWVFDAVWNEMGIVEERPDYQFMAKNGTLDLLGAARLLWDDYLYLPAEELGWDELTGHHIVGEPRGNAPRIFQEPNLVACLVALTQKMSELLKVVEADEGLIVKREAIAEPLLVTLLDGDLTGSELFALQMLAGMLRIEGEPGAYQVTYDDRLALGIPGFYDLVVRMIGDVRAYNEEEGPFSVTFTATHGDRGIVLPEIEGPVEGAFVEPTHVVEVAE